MADDDIVVEVDDEVVINVDDIADNPADDSKCSASGDPSSARRVRLT